MVTSYVLMNISPLLETDILQTLSNYHEVVELHQLNGEYDLMAKIEAHDFKNIGELITSKIKKINGITTTKTLLRI